MVTRKKIWAERLRRQIWHDYYSQMWFKYHTRFFGALIFRGKKIKAFNMLLKIQQKLKIMENADPYFVFLVALMKVTPNILIKSVRLGGSTQSIPVPISEEMRITFGVKWIIKLLKDKRDTRLSVDTLAELLVASIYNRGISIQKKLQVYARGKKNRHLLRFLRVSK